MEGFIEIKEKYVELRSIERKSIIKFLVINGYTIINQRGGEGNKGYTSNNTLRVPYDLSNWKWIEVEKEGVYFIISLQVFDMDVASGNHHVLMDRLGVYKYTKYNAKEAFEDMIVTDIDLPMNDEKMNKLLEYL